MSARATRPALARRASQPHLTRFPEARAPRRTILPERRSAESMEREALKPDEVDTPLEALVPRKNDVLAEIGRAHV